jgi:thiamine biosynthesis lipoprotein
MNKILIENFIAAEKISKLTEGNFDISLGAVIEAHGYAAKERKKLSKQELDSMMLYVGYEKLRLEGNKLIKQYPQTRIDFNAIAQGYTTDAISKYLTNNKISQHIVDVGGEVYASGRKPDGQQWRVAIEKPSKDMYAEREYNSFVKLENKSIVTSGNYRKYVEEDGIRLSHTIDPKTGHSVSHNLLSVSVIAENATLADGLATAFMVMGKEKAEEFLKTHPEYDAIFIYSNSKGEIETSHTKNLDKILEIAE